MPNPPQAAFLEALGWTILNSWWQFGLLWIVSLFLKKVLPKGSSALRHNFSLALLALGICSTFFFFLFRWQSILNGGYYVVSVTQNHTYNFYLNVNFYLSLALPYISTIYLMWLGFNLLHFAWLLHISRQLKIDGLQKAPVDWRLFLSNMSAQMNIQNTVQLWISSNIDTPMILGWLKPVILLPASAIFQLSSDQLEAILVHEMAHIKRNDYFWNILVAFTEVIFYYNPFARWLINEIRIERENSCDDWVLQFPYQPEQYAHALLKLEHQRIGKQSRLLLAARGTSRSLLLSRVQRMLNLPLSNQERKGHLTLMLVFAVLLGLVSIFKPSPVSRPFIKENVLLSVSGIENQYQKEINSLKGNNKTPLKNALADRHFPKSSPKKPFHPIWTAVENGFPESVNLLRVENKISQEMEKAMPALITEERTFSLLQDNSVQLSFPNLSNNLPYIPKSSFQSLRQQDSIIPQAILTEKLAILQEKEATLQANIALAQGYWEKLLEEKMANIDLSEKYDLKKNQLEDMQIQLERQAKQFEQLIEKQAKMLQKQLQKSPLKRKIVRI